MEETTAPIVKAKILSYGTFVTTDIARAQAFFVEFLGLEAVRQGERLFVRDRGTQPKGHRSGHPYWVLDVQQVPEVTHPQKVLNHWGIDMADREGVDHAHAMATDHGAQYGIKKVMPVRVQHQSYAFYFQDFDSNWWEVLTRTPGREPEKLFEAKQDIYDKDGAKL